MLYIMLYILGAEEMLNNLNAERDLYETRMMMSESNLFEDFAGGEIIEHWNENQITEWKSKTYFSLQILQFVIYLYILNTINI